MSLHREKGYCKRKRKSPIALEIARIHSTLAQSSKSTWPPHASILGRSSGLSGCNGKSVYV